MEPVDAAFGAFISDEARREALAQALPDLTPASLLALQGLSSAEWTSLRAEMARVLQSAQRAEVRDAQLTEARQSLETRVDTRFDAAERQLAGEILSPLLVANSTYDAEATTRAEVARLTAAWSRSQAQLDLYREAIVPQSGTVLDAARNSYVAGRGDFPAVIEGFEMWLESRLQLANREAERFTTWAEIDALLTPSNTEGQQ